VEYLEVLMVRTTPLDVMLMHLPLQEIFKSACRAREKGLGGTARLHGELAVAHAMISRLGLRRDSQPWQGSPGESQANDSVARRTRPS